MGVKRAEKRRIDDLRVKVGVKESFKKMVRSRLKLAGLYKEWEIRNWQRDQMPRKWRGKIDEEDSECDGRTAL